MSSLPITLSLVSLPLFWLILSRFGNPSLVARLNPLLPRLSIAGSIALLAVVLGAAYWLQPAGTGALVVKVHPLNAVVIALVVFIGVILVRYSRNYMSGEQCYPAFFRWMKLTLAAVVVTLLSNHLLLFWLGWVCISLSLHRLLVLYPDRPRAVLGAHKKFLLARLSEACILLAFTLLYWVFETLYIDHLLQGLTAFSALSHQDQTLVEVAAMLIAAAAILKCAQLPFHGWLINIVEAPTPVSALLHAGVINLGGYLLLVFAPLIAQIPSAQWLLLLSAGLSTLCAALIMTTRVSVKVRLAWSTSSQMGLMLIECALGLYALALVHLVAHSLYKAFAFLNSGNAVYEQIESSVAGLRLPRAGEWISSWLTGALVLWLCVWLAGDEAPLAPWLLLSLSLISLLATRTQSAPRAALRTGVLVTVGLVASYALWKLVAGSYLVSGFPPAVAPLSAMDLWICGVFLVLFALSWALRLWPQVGVIQRFRQALFAGLYLDEWFTRVTLKLWPVTLRGAQQINPPVATITRIGSR